ncbi:G-PROTEIN-RECEP-F1-2 domain-containing protein [Aphelenchoides besseyi]|nr:G-PROTEIN-RECEP-F1-2 domain-containing protein [Aphelenchoides besseyi]
MTSSTEAPKSTVTNCFGNISDDVTAILKFESAQELNYIYKVWQGWIPLPLAVAGLLFATLYIAAVYRAIKQHRVSRKCYVLLLNRAFGDTFACVMAITISIYTASKEIVSRETMQAIDVFFMASFWSSMTSYVALSLIKLYAVWSPLQYRKRITMRRCIYLIALSWLIFSFFTGYAMSMIALVRIPFLNEWSGCRVETCLRYMYRVRNCMVIIVYTVTIVCFTITVILIRRARKFMRRFHQQSTNAAQNGTTPRRRSLKERFPLWKLSVNVSTFAFFNIFYAIWAIGLTYKGADRCFFLKHFNLMMYLLAFVRISLLVRIVADPVIAFITDVQIRRSIIAMFGLQNTIRPMDSNKRRLFFGRSQRSEDNSSDADLKNMAVSPRQSTKTAYITDRVSVEKDNSTS